MLFDYFYQHTQYVKCERTLPVSSVSMQGSKNARQYLTISPQFRLFAAFSPIPGASQKCSVHWTSTEEEITHCPMFLCWAGGFLGLNGFMIETYLGNRSLNYCKSLEVINQRNNAENNGESAEGWKKKKKKRHFLILWHTRLQTWLGIISSEKGWKGTRKESSKTRRVWKEEMVRTRWAERTLDPRDVLLGFQIMNDIESINREQLFILSHNTWNAFYTEKIFSE